VIGLMGQWAVWRRPPTMIRNIQDVSTALKDCDQQWRDLRLADCFRAGHVWRPLETLTLGSGPAAFADAACG